MENKQQASADAYIANGCCVAIDREENAWVVIYLPKRESGAWIAYGPDGVKPAPSFSYRIIL